MDEWIANTFNGATTMQIGIALFITLGMIWVLWIGARSSNRPPRPGDTAPPTDPV